MSLFPDTNETLIARVKDLGDGISWAEFESIYRPVILRMAKKRGMQDADALDVIQQVFVSVAKSIEGWSPLSSGPPFRAWLSTIARNAISNALARRSLDVAIGGTSVVNQLQLLPDKCTLGETQCELVRETRHQAILWAAEQIRHEFSDEVWQCFWRTAIQGESVSEVAASFHRSAGSIYVTRYRIIARLKEKVQELSKTWDT